MLCSQMELTNPNGEHISIISTAAPIQRRSPFQQLLAALCFTFFVADSSSPSLGSVILITLSRKISLALDMTSGTTLKVRHWGFGVNGGELEKR